MAFARDKKGDARSVSRRNFFKLMGSLIALPTVAGGFMVPPTIAYALTGGEKDGGNTDDGTTKITLVKADEVGFVVVDTADGGETKIAGAHVTITSRYNQAKVEGVTNSEGKVILSVMKLAENPENYDLDKLDSYAFNGTVDVTCAGYRDFHIDLTRIQGGGGFLVPTRSVTDGKPFPLTVSFDEWDVLYTENTFGASKSNDEKHTISAEFWQVDEGEATVSLKVNDNDKTVLSKTASPSKGALKVSFEGQFLKTGHADALPLKAEFYIVINQGSNIYRWPIHLNVSELVVEEPVTKSVPDFRPINTIDTANTGLELRWPEFLPLVGGGVIKPFMPELPINLYVNPWGMLQFTAKTPSWGYKRDSGTEAGATLWKKYPLKSADEQFAKAMDTCNKMSQSTANAYNRDGVFRNIDTFWTFKATGNFQIVAVAKWDNKKGLFQGMLGGQLIIGIGYSITENFFAGPIPILVTFTFDFNTIISLTAAAYAKKEPKRTERIIDVALDFSRWEFDYSNTGLTITFSLTPTLSLGVGVRGIASASVRGRFVLVLAFGFTCRGELDTETHPLPHYCFGYSADIVVILSLLMFTSNIEITSWKYRDFYDNWKGGLQEMSSMADDPLAELADASLSDVLSRMHIVTEGMLSQVKEFDGSSLSPAADDSQNEVFDWETMRKEDIVAPLEDGTTITYAVYALDSKAGEEGDESLTASADDGAADESSTTNETVTSESAVDEGIAAGEGTVDEAAGEAEASGDAGASAQPAVATAATVAATLHATRATVCGGAGSLRQASDEEVGDIVETVPEQTEAAASSSESSPELAVPQEEAVANPADAEAKTAGAVYRRKASPVTYEPVNTGLTAMADGPLLPDLGISKLGSHGGVRPSSDKKLLENVYGDPRIRVVDLHTQAGTMDLRATCSFRIGAVSIDGQMRTRIIMTVISASGNMGSGVDFSTYAGYKKPLDFEIDDLPGVSHKRLFDYDFDVEFTSEDGTDQVHIVVVSGVRAQGDSTSLSSAATDLYFTYLSFAVGDAFGRTTYVTRSICVSSLTDDGMFHNISDIALAGDGTEKTASLLVGYVDRMADVAENVLSDDPALVTTKVSFLTIDIDENTWKTPDSSVVDSKIGDITNGSVGQLILSPKINGAYTLTLVGLKQTNFYVLTLDDSTSTFTDIKRCKVIDGPVRLIPWPQQNCFLVSYPDADYLPTIATEPPKNWDRSRWCLQKATWDMGAEEPTLQTERIGAKNFNFTNFGINAAGTFIFWPQMRSGDDGRILNEDGTFTVNDDVPLYQLMACRVYKGKFSDPFVVADVPHDMSQVAIVTTRDRYAPLEVLSTEYIDSSETDDKGNPLRYASNLWYTAIPNLRCATAVGCNAPVPFVAPGDQLRFHVTIRNDGNSYLSGCTVQLCVHDRQLNDQKQVVKDTATAVEGSTAQLVFGKSTLIESIWNPRENGELVGVEDDYSLAPGKRSVYQVYVTIPKDWSGEKVVSFIAKDPQLAEGGGLAALADDDPVYMDFSVEPGEYRPKRDQATSEYDDDQAYMHSITVGEAVADASFTADAPLSYTENDDSGSSGSGGNSSTSGGSSSGGSSSGAGGSKTGAGGSGGKNGSNTALPDTGDPFTPALPAGLALAGAAALAYERRRAENEAAGDEP